MKQWIPSGLAAVGMLAAFSGCRSVPRGGDEGSETITKNWSPLTEAERREALTGTVDFARHVQPVLRAKCVACHSGRGAMAGLRLDERSSAFAAGGMGPRIVPGNPEKSALLKMLKPHTKGQATMPPVGHQVVPDEAKILRRWIEQGAAWPR